ncbi:Protein of unknown function [Cotesia congregata]|uniref:THAP-type domain-containing protein n=1 Tax=Cotesia congregata TaxID=51543 RepID=A0A8J2EA64_COTCN|nr:Protein of unknown function [Cotesia congregata]
MGGCSFPDCHNSSEKGFKMLRFFYSVEMRSKWTSACKISKLITENSRLCEGHFSKGLFDCDNHLYKLKKNVTPDILIPSPGKPFDVFETDDDNDNHYSVKSNRHKSRVS